MLQYKLTIPDADVMKNVDISIFSMPVLDSRMYIFSLDGLSLSSQNGSPKADTGKRELLIVDPNLWGEADGASLRQICESADHATVLMTHSHYDHIAGMNTLRQMIPATLYATPLCDKKMQDSHKNLAAYSMALVMDKTEERQRYCEQYFDFDYGCQADELYEGSLGLLFQSNNNTSLYIRTIPAPGHSDCSQCIELWHREHLLAVLTGDSLVNGHDVITRFPSGSKKVFRDVTEPYLRSLSDDTLILPGHGDPAPFGDIKEYAII